MPKKGSSAVSTLLAFHFLGCAGGSSDPSPVEATPEPKAADTCPSVCEHIASCLGDPERNQNVKDVMFECVYSCGNGSVGQEALDCWAATPCADLHRDTISFGPPNVCPAVEKAKAAEKEAERAKHLAERASLVAKLQAELLASTEAPLTLPPGDWEMGWIRDLLVDENATLDVLARLMRMRRDFKKEKEWLARLPEPPAFYPFKDTPDPAACAEEFPGSDEFATKDRAVCESEAEAAATAQFEAHKQEAETWRKEQQTRYASTLRVFNLSRESSKMHEAYSFDDARYLVGIRGYDRCDLLAENHTGWAVDTSTIGWKKIDTDPNSREVIQFFAPWPLNEEAARERKAFTENIRTIQLAVVVDGLGPVHYCDKPDYFTFNEASQPPVQLSPVAYRFCTDECSEWISP